MLLTALSHPVIYVLPYAIGLFVVLFVDASGEQADFVVRVLKPRFILVVAIRLFPFGETQLRRSLSDGSFYLLLAGTFSRRTEIRSSGESSRTAPKTGDVVLGRRLAQKVAPTHFRGFVPVTVLQEALKVWQ